MINSELYQRVLAVGHIIECGVFLGAGLMNWANLSAINEPFNRVRCIVGFDTFSGIIRVGPQDGRGALQSNSAGCGFG